MSDSELSDAPSVENPPDHKLEKSLRDETRKAVESGGDVTVRRVRDASTKALGLPEGFYASEKWKSISKELIREEHERLENNSLPTKPPKKSVSKPTHEKTTAAPKRPSKRPSSGQSAPPKKKSKLSHSDEESSALSSRLSDIGSDPSSQDEKSAKSSKAKPKRLTSSRAAAPSKKDIRDIASDEDEGKSHNLHQEEDRVARSDSEMSVVLDDEPAKKRRSKSKDAAESKTSKPKPAKVKVQEDDDPDKEEIKKLQGWLVKCGVRKVWGKELKPFESSKAKIKHLRGMLGDVGLTGRFSNEKAAQIKESRELAADIEAVQEGAQRWGKSDEEDNTDDNRTRNGRRLVRGAKHYDFLSSDGEETD